MRLKIKLAYYCKIVAERCNIKLNLYQRSSSNH